MVDVVNLSSSPEPAQTPTTRTRHRELVEVIEISDLESDSDVVMSPALPDSAPSSRKPATPAVDDRQLSQNDGMQPHQTSLLLGAVEDIPNHNKTTPESLRLRLSTDSRDKETNFHTDNDASFNLNQRVFQSQNTAADPTDPLSQYLARVLEVIPDVQPEHVHNLIKQSVPDQWSNVVERILHILFEDPNYPKVDRKGKRKATEDPLEFDASIKRNKLDYSSRDREYKGGRYYHSLVLDQLSVDFPDVPKAYIRKMLLTQNRLYVPTYVLLASQKKHINNLPYTNKSVRPNGKGKRRVLKDVEFDLERAWLLQELDEQAAVNDAVMAEEMNTLEYGDGIECGCCFTAYPFDKMIQCPDTHLFCVTCMQQYAETLLGSHDTNLVCMDQSGCKQPFPISELRRFLPEKLLSLYERIKQDKEIEMAGLEGLEECPFCEYKCVIENPDEKLFQCGNEEICGAVTCRKCKKNSHLPKSCEETEKERHLDGRHTIEEAMTQALMRNCPKCKQAFIKEEGCNKMTCPNCRTLSCYMCREIIHGYEHFAQPGVPQIHASSSSRKCPLWDANIEQIHNEEVKAAADKAMAQYRAEHPDIDLNQIQVDLPKTKAKQAPIIPNMGPGYYQQIGHGMLRVPPMVDNLDAYRPRHVHRGRKIRR